ncbi:hypothetical protein PG989_012080 [Apiospora arundinis]
MQQTSPRTVKVVLTYWDSDYRENRYVKSRVDHLQQVLKDRFGFKVSCHGLDQDADPENNNQQIELANFLLQQAGDARPRRDPLHIISHPIVPGGSKLTGKDLLFFIYIGSSEQSQKRNCLLRPVSDSERGVRVDFDAVRRNVLNKLAPEVLMILDCPYHSRVSGDSRLDQRRVNVLHVERREVITSSIQTPDLVLTRALANILDRAAREPLGLELTSLTLFVRLEMEMSTCVASPVRSLLHSKSRNVHDEKETRRSIINLSRPAAGPPLRDALRSNRAVKPPARPNYAALVMGFSIRSLTQRQMACGRRASGKS